MMQGVADRILGSGSLSLLAAAIAVVMAAALILLAVRILFARRVKAPANGRARLAWNRQA